MELAKSLASLGLGFHLLRMELGSQPRLWKGLCEDNPGAAAGSGPPWREVSSPWRGRKEAWRTESSWEFKVTSSCPEVLGWPQHVCRGRGGLGLLTPLCPALLRGNVDESLHLSEPERSVTVATQGVPGAPEAPGSHKELGASDDL